MKILIVDKNKSLIAKVKKAIKYLPVKNIDAKVDNIINYCTKDFVIASASNPDFTFGGGVDAVIAPCFTKEITKLKKSKNQRIGNLTA